MAENTQAKVRIADTAYGHIMVPEADTIQRHWFEGIGRSSEDDSIRLCSELVAERPRGVMIDAGAGYGEWTLAMADLFDRSIAYEAHPSIFLFLAGTMALNGMFPPRVEVRNLALWSMNRRLRMPLVDMGIGSNFGGLSAIGPLDDQPDAPFVDVYALALTHWQAGNDRVSFIKIDCEGAESEILRGAQVLIERDRPLMFIEAIHKHTDKARVESQIRGLDYEIYETFPNLVCVPQP